MERLPCVITIQILNFRCIILYLERMNHFKFGNCICCCRVMRLHNQTRALQWKHLDNTCDTKRVLEGLIEISRDALWQKSLCIIRQRVPFCVATNRKAHYCHYSLHCLVCTLQNQSFQVVLVTQQAMPSSANETGVSTCKATDGTVAKTDSDWQSFEICLLQSVAKRFVTPSTSSWSSSNQKLQLIDWLVPSWSQFNARTIHAMQLSPVKCSVIGSMHES